MKQITENTILLILLLIGGLGLLFHFSNTNSDTNNDFEIVLLENGAFDSSSHEISALWINGAQEVGLPLHFEVITLAKDAKYFLELGNGERIPMDQNRNSFTYREPGNYQINLKTIQNGEELLVQSRQVRISQHLASK